MRFYFLKTGKSIQDLIPQTHQHCGAPLLVLSLQFETFIRDLTASAVNSARSEVNSGHFCQYPCSDFSSNKCDEPARLTSGRVLYSARLKQPIGPLFPQAARVLLTDREIHGRRPVKSASTATVWAPRQQQLQQWKRRHVLRKTMINICERELLKPCSSSSRSSKNSPAETLSRLPRASFGHVLRA